MSSYAAKVHLIAGVPKLGPKVVMNLKTRRMTHQSHDIEAAGTVSRLVYCSPFLISRDGHS